MVLFHDNPSRPPEPFAMAQPQTLVTYYLSLVLIRQYFNVLFLFEVLFCFHDYSYAFMVTLIISKKLGGQL